MCDTCNLCILLCNALCRINYHNDDIGTLYCCNSTNDTITLKILVNLALAAKTCCVNKDILAAISLKRRINGITCCSCNVRYNHTLLAYKTVYDR